MEHTEVVIRIIALAVVVVFFPITVLVIFRWKDKANDKVAENRKSERKKLNDKKKN